MVRRTLSLCLLLLIGLQGAVSARTAVAGNWGLDSLMQELLKNNHGRAIFREKKYIQLLDKPVESSGELVFVPPDHLEKNTLLPRSELLILDHGTLTIQSAEQKHTLQLSDYPEVSAFIDSIRGTLAGDRKALEKVYRLFLGGSARHWTLILLPIAREMSLTINRIKIEGVNGQVRSVEILQADGDRSVMTIEPPVSK